MNPPTNNELLAACAALGLAPDAQIGWRNVSMTHLSIARFRGAATVNGKRFTYFWADDTLWRDDVVQAVQKARKAAQPAEPVPERAAGCTQGCNGCDDCTDYDDRPGDECLHCHGDGMDPDCDYLLPCPDCGGSW